GGDHPPQPPGPAGADAGPLPSGFPGNSHRPGQARRPAPERLRRRGQLGRCGAARAARSAGPARVGDSSGSCAVGDRTASGSGEDRRGRVADILAGVIAVHRPAEAEEGQEEQEFHGPRIAEGPISPYPGTYATGPRETRNSPAMPGNAPPKASAPQLLSSWA